MNWDAIGAIGEITGALAVVISLVYLATQIRAQNREARLAAMHEVSNNFREVTSKFATEDMSEIMVRANKNFDDLSDAEAVRLVILGGGLFRGWEEAFIQHREGRLDNSIWQAIHNHYGLVMNGAGIRRVWLLRKSLYNEDFVAFVDTLEPGEYVFR